MVDATMALFALYHSTGGTFTPALDVWSRHLVERVEPEPFRLECPSFADERVGREPLQRLEPAPEVGGGDEVRQVHAQLVVRGGVEALNGRRLDGPVHPLDLPVRPRVARLGAAWRGLARLGAAWRGLARLGAAWRGLARLGAAWRGLARLGAAWSDGAPHRSGRR